MKNTTSEALNANFKKLGLKQKYILKQMVVNDYFILKTINTTDNTTTISLIDDWHNYDIDLSDKDLKSIVKRGFLLSADISKCLEFIQEKFWLNELFVNEALNACKDIIQ